ncbi:MAG: hypothetical protein GY822_24965 [Deltaproteobacteria bacterium]|nr:hypothetical protein [Deltaproteobacteria bacterium]
MGKETPYGVLLRVRKSQEEQARAMRAQAAMAKQAAKEAMERVHRESQRDHRQRGDAQLWSMMDVAHGQKLRELKEATDAFSSAKSALDEAAELHLERRKDERVVQRMSEKRILEQKKAEERRERKELDDLAVMRFARD